MNGKLRKVLIAVAFLLVPLLVAVPAVWAFETREGQDIVVDEVVEDDLYVAAGTFTLNGTVEGDLVVAGSSIEINGTVEGDLWAAGSSVSIAGTVNDDARITGYGLFVSGDVEDDLFGVAFSLENQEGSTVGGSLVYAGYQALLAGSIDGDANVAGGAVQLDGSIGGDATIDVGGTEPGMTFPMMTSFIPNVPSIPSVPTGLTLGEGASIGGDLEYTANQEADIPSGVVSGQTDFEEYVPRERPEQRRRSPVLRWLWNQAQRFLGLIVVGGLMMWLVPGWTRKMANNIESKPLPSLGWGFVAIAAFVVALLVLILATGLGAAVLGLVTFGELLGRVIALGGIAVSTLTFGFSITWAYVTKVIVALLLGMLIFRLLKSDLADNRWVPVLLGIVLFVPITAVPIIGWLIAFVAIVFGLGAIWIWGLEKVRATEPAPAPAAGPEETE